MSWILLENINYPYSLEQDYLDLMGFLRRTILPQTYILIFIRVLPKLSQFAPSCP